MISIAISIITTIFITSTVIAIPIIATITIITISISITIVVSVTAIIIITTVTIFVKAEELCPPGFFREGQPPLVPADWLLG